MILDAQHPSVNVFPNGGNGGNGDGAFGGGYFFWIIILFFFALMMGWGNNGNASGGNGGVSYVPYNIGGQNYMQQGFDQAAIMNGISGIQNSLASAEVSRCNQQANILATLNTNQIASMSEMNGLAMSLQNCCCENRAATADLKYALATEGAAIRQNCDSNKQAIMDKLCQLELDGVRQNYEGQLRAMDNQLQSARSEIQSLRFAASQGAQTAQILANNEAQTTALEQYLAPVARPAYIVQNPNGCVNNNLPGCVCGR